LTVVADSSPLLLSNSVCDNREGEDFDTQDASSHHLMGAGKMASPFSTTTSPAIETASRSASPLGRGLTSSPLLPVTVDELQTQPLVDEREETVLPKTKGLVFVAGSSEQAVPRVGPFPQPIDGLDEPTVVANGPPALSQRELSPLNRYECLILQDEDSVVHDPLLKRTPYIVNVRYLTLICVECKRSVDPDQASSHARRLHSYCKIAAGFVTEIKRKYPGLKAEKIHPAGVVKPIFGLAVPPSQYEVCTRCLRGYSNPPSFRNHACENPQMDLKGKPHSFRSHVQTFFHGQRICYFPIDTPTSTADETNVDDFTVFQSQYAQFDAIGDEVVKPDEYRELDQFLYKEDWISHVAGYKLSDLSTLTCLPQQDDIIAPIRSEVFVLMSKIQAVIGSAGFHVRRLLGRRPS
jgi:hypothetical protein